MAALFTGTVAAATAMAAAAMSDDDRRARERGGGADGGGRRMVVPAGATSPSSTTPLNRADRGGRIPAPATARGGKSPTNLPIQTVLGVHNGVALCVREQADMLRVRRPDSAQADCCYMTMGQGEWYR